MAVAGPQPPPKPSSMQQSPAIDDLPRPRSPPAPPPQRSWSWTRIDGRNVFAVPTRAAVHMYDSDDFILINSVPATGHRAPIRFVRWSTFHGKLASLSAAQVMVHAPRRRGEGAAASVLHGDGGGVVDNRVAYAPICDFSVADAGVQIRGLAFSRCADRLLFCGRGGLGMLDVSADPTPGAVRSMDDGGGALLWTDRREDCDLAKFSPSAFVFASLKFGAPSIKVWRMKRSMGTDADRSTTSKSPKLAGVQTLSHNGEPLVYFSWKPARTPRHAAHETDGCRRAQWFEPPRTLLTTSAARTIRVWTEEVDETGGHTDRSQLPRFVAALEFSPTQPIDNFRWVLSKNRNISDERFRVADARDETLTDWLSGVDHHGVLRLWRLVGLHGPETRRATVEETPFRVQVDGETGEDNGEDGSARQADLSRRHRFGEGCVMAYFAQNLSGMPSRFDIVLQRGDHIVLSFVVAVGQRDGEPSRIQKKSWFRSHVGNIAALAAHPSLPLVASVDAQQREDGRPQAEILVYWLSFSAFSAETRLIPSGVLTCAPDCGRVLCIQWIPTLHFDATPMLLVAFESGVIHVYGRSANASGVVASPRSSLSSFAGPQLSHKLVNSPVISPWTYFDYATGESGVEYEVSVIKPEGNAPLLQLVAGPDAKLVVNKVSDEDPGLSQITVGDELVGINNKSVVGKDVEELKALLELIPTGELLLMRFRGNSRPPMPELSLTGDGDSSNAETAGSPALPEKTPGSTSVPFMLRYSSKDGSMASSGDQSTALDEQLKDCAKKLQSELLTTIPEAPPDFTPQLSPDSSSSSTIYAGSVSTYGGWMDMLSQTVASHLALVYVCPAYADDGEYVPEAVVLFGLSALPGKLLAWKGMRSSGSGLFSLSPLTIQHDVVNAKRDITAISGERDYRQRAFSSSQKFNVADGLNSLLFVGDAGGEVEHWRCRIMGDEINFTLMSAFHISTPAPTTELNGASGLGSFYRRGYLELDYLRHVSSDESTEANGQFPKGGVLHIEVDDPNRIAVVDADRPDEIDILEAESGLGILRLDETIRAAKRGRILGFCWCSSHVEFNVDALAVNYSSGLVVYQFDMKARRWTPISDDAISSFAIFDCTRDSSALLIGGGQAAVNDANESHASNASNVISNEMPSVIGKWDEPGHVLQDAMDWKVAESPQKLPVWHPYVIMTTLFGMHARVGEKDTSLAGDKVTYAFSRAFKDAVQMLKLLVQVMKDDTAAYRSARTGVLSVSAQSLQEEESLAEEETNSQQKRSERNSIGRYSTEIHKPAHEDKAEFLFAPAQPRVSHDETRQNQVEKPPSSKVKLASTLSLDEMDTLRAGLDALLLGKGHTMRQNAVILFGSFETEHLVEMHAILSYVNTIQSLGFDLDKSGADLGAKRYYSMMLFSQSLKGALALYCKETESTRGEDTTSSSGESDPLEGEHHEPEWDKALASGTDTRDTLLGDIPSSGLLWALHSDAQTFLLERCFKSQMSWDRDLRPMWLGLWVKDANDLREIVERFAKQLYSRSRDAMEVCLYYIALGKNNILGALAKMSRDDRNRTLSAFLEHDFTQERWRNAAVKNAYSLLSKKQFEASAAFFLLSKPPRLQEAMRVLAIRHGDPSLALVIARLVEYRESAQFQHDFVAASAQRGVTPAGPIARRLIGDEILPIFRDHGDRWLESCALWWLEEFEHSCTVVMPQAQDVDIPRAAGDAGDDSLTLASKTTTASGFYVNLTSITLYFQYLHSTENSSMVNWVKTVRRAAARAASDPISSTGRDSGTRRFRLATVTDIEHAFSFSAYVCKRNGLSDTALVEMLQARHLINTHARFELSVLDSTSSSADSPTPPTSNSASDMSETPTSPRFSSPRRFSSISRADLPTSPRFSASMRNLPVGRLSCVTSDDWVTSGGAAAWSASPRRMSDINHTFSPTVKSPVSSPPTSRQSRRPMLRRASTSGWTDLLQSEKPLPTAPWLKAQLADLECRRWSSSAFVGKMIGIRVAREMISHFRTDLVHLFIHYKGTAISPRSAQPVKNDQPGCPRPHKEYLEELCLPLCDQFQLDRVYVLEAALAVLQPHAYLHIAEVCFLLSELGRAASLRKWVQYVTLSMLRSCATFASCSITEHVYRDWESLTVQLCYLLQLDAAHEIELSPKIVATVNVAVRTGIIFLGWIRHRSDIVRDAISIPLYVPTPGLNSQSGSSTCPTLSAFAFAKGLAMLRKLEHGTPVATTTLSDRSGRPHHRAFDSSFGYTFLGSVASYLTKDDTGEVSLMSWGGMHDATSVLQFKLRKMYTLVLMVSVLRTLHARAQAFLDVITRATAPAMNEASDFYGRATPVRHHPRGSREELDISSSLFTPRKLWKDLGEGPLEGIKRWFALTESHLRFEFDYSVKEVQCVCGLFGLDRAVYTLSARRDIRSVVRPITSSGMARRTSDTSDNPPDENSPDEDHPASMVKHRLDSASSVEPAGGDLEAENGSHETRAETLVRQLEARGLPRDLHRSLLQSSDDYILLLLKAGVPQSFRRFRADPRVYVKSFILRDVFAWFAAFEIFEDPVEDGRAFLARCCKERKLRLLVAHRGEDTQLFPQGFAPPHRSSSEPPPYPHPQASPPNPGSAEPNAADSRMARGQSVDGRGSEPGGLHGPALDALHRLAMMFVDPWEVEAVASARHYLHGGLEPRHVELGRDRLSPICAETCDGIIASVFENTDLVDMWKETRGEGWLVTAITQYQLDGVHSTRCRRQASGPEPSNSEVPSDEETGDEDDDEPQVPFLIEVHSRAQRNSMFEESGLPHRFVGVVTVGLVEARELVSCNWLTEGSEPYVFLELAHAGEPPRAEPDGWSVSTYRSRVGRSEGRKAVWGTSADQFAFRFAVPTHQSHVSTGWSHGLRDYRYKGAAAAAAAAWETSGSDDSEDVGMALESLLPPLFAGPPAVLHCSVYHKNKVLAHQLMGRGQIELAALMSGAPIDCWVPLDDGRSGALHIGVSLSFPLMCSSPAAVQERRSLR